MIIIKLWGILLETGLMFNWKFYVTYYSDLKHIKDHQTALRHYNSKGKSEGRYAHPGEFISGTGFQWKNFVEYSRVFHLNTPFDTVIYYLKNRSKYPDTDYFIPSKIKEAPDPNPRFKGIQNITDPKELGEPEKNKILSPGISLLYISCNEESTIADMLDPFFSLLDEIVIVDNNSADSTSVILKQMQSDHPNLHVYTVQTYHVDMAENCAVPMFKLLNWGLTKVTRFNFIYWKREYRPFPEALEKIINIYNLRYNDTPIAIRLTGRRAYLHGKEVYYDMDVHMEDYLIFSKLNHFSWLAGDPPQISRKYLMSSRELTLEPIIYYELDGNNFPLDYADSRYSKSLNIVFPLRKKVIVFVKNWLDEEFFQQLKNYLGDKICFYRTIPEVPTVAANGITAIIGFNEVPPGHKDIHKIVYVYKENYDMESTSIVENRQNITYWFAKRIENQKFVPLCISSSKYHLLKSKYHLLKKDLSTKRLILGWIGTRKKPLESGYEVLRNIVNKLDFLELKMLSKDSLKDHPSRKQLIEFMKEIHVLINLDSNLCGQYNLLCASAFGIPWISASGLVADTLYNGTIDKPGIIIPLKEDTLKENLIYLRNHPTKLDKMGRIGRELIERRYSWGVIIPKMFYPLTIQDSSHN